MVVERWLAPFGHDLKASIEAARLCLRMVADLPASIKENLRETAPHTIDLLLDDLYCGL